MQKNSPWLCFWFCLLLTACSEAKPKPILFPTANSVEIRQLCREPYRDPSSAHQQWATSRPAWLMSAEHQLVVYFDNDRAYVIERRPEITLPVGKYRCIQ